MTQAPLVLHHHPYTRASTVVWMLEELGRPYELRYVEIMKGGQKSPELLALNPMGKIPILVDGETVVTEVAAIGLYLADRYALGELAPAPDSPARGAYLRWSVFAPSVIEPASMTRLKGWDASPSQAGWGEYESMLAAASAAIGEGPFLLGETFSMADVIFGSTLRFMLRFKMMAPTPLFSAYVARLEARPACQAADAKNASVAEERGLSAG